MKYTLQIDPECEEEIIIHAHSKNELIESIERLVNAKKLNTHRIIGYIRDDIIDIDPAEVYCFFIEDKKLYASLKRGNALIKKRLYELEDLLDEGFIKINQSTVANLKMVDHFSVSLGATLTVHFKNGRRDYVSRRQMKSVKERLGI